MHCTMTVPYSTFDPFTLQPYKSHKHAYKTAHQSRGHLDVDTCLKNLHTAGFKSDLSLVGAVLTL